MRADERKYHFQKLNTKDTSMRAIILLQFSWLKPSVCMSLSVNKIVPLSQNANKTSNTNKMITQRYLQWVSNFFKTSLSSLAEISICCKIYIEKRRRMLYSFPSYCCRDLSVVMLLPLLPLACPFTVPPHQHTHTPPSAHWLPSTHVPCDLLEDGQELLVLLTFLPSGSWIRLNERDGYK